MPIKYSLRKAPAHIKQEWRQYADHLRVVLAHLVLDRGMSWDNAAALIKAKCRRLHAQPRRGIKLLRLNNLIIRRHLARGH